MNDETTVDETASEELILGKFKNNEEVVKAYQELEKKLGEKSAEKVEEKKEEPVADSSKEIAALRKEIEEIKAAKAEVKKPLDEKDFREQVAEGLNALPKEKADSVKQRIQSGDISEGELQFIADLGVKPAESSDRVSEDEANVAGNTQDAYNEYTQLLRTQAAVYLNVQHPQHKEVLDRKNLLEKKLGIK